jgi:hypothetical protein
MLAIGIFLFSLTAAVAGFDHQVPVALVSLAIFRLKGIATIYKR